MAPPTQRAVLVHRREVGGEVFELTFEPLDEPVFYRAGQWLPFHLPVAGAETLVRAYSMAEPMREDGRLCIALDVVAGGLGSAWLAECEPGREVRIGPAQGAFTLEPGRTKRPLALVGRGTGVVPLRCLLLDRVRAAGSGDAEPAAAWLIHDGGPYDEELDRLARETSWLELRRVQAGAESDALLECLAQLDAPAVLVAGVRAMVLPLRELLADRGVAPLRSELFD